MHSYKKLIPSILILLVVGIAVNIHNATYHPSIQDTSTEEINPVIVYDTVVVDNNDLINSIETTLEVADGAIGGMVDDKRTTSRTISYLNKVVNEEKEIISNLEKELANKDSLILSRTLELEALTEQFTLLELQFEETVQIYTQRYNKLVQENNTLKLDLDNSNLQIKYLDSLILTNKKLTKAYESD